MPRVELICLANSRKHGGRCVAGLRADGQGWVRPVGKLPDGTLYPTDYMLSDLTEPGPLDLIRVGLGSARPAQHEPENFIVDGTQWELLSRPIPTALASVLRSARDARPELLGSVGDRIAWSDFQRSPATASLALVEPATLLLYQQMNYQGRPQVRGSFALDPCGKNALYDLVVTDRYWESLVRSRGDQKLVQTDARFLVTISMGEPFGLYCYKLIAAVIPLPPAIAAAH